MLETNASDLNESVRNSMILDTTPLNDEEVKIREST